LSNYDDFTDDYSSWVIITVAESRNGHQYTLSVTQFCTAGHEYSSQLGTCVSCPRGRVKPPHNISWNLDVCVLCPPDTINNKTGATSFTWCIAAGKIISTGGWNSIMIDNTIQTPQPQPGDPFAISYPRDLLAFYFDNLMWFGLTFALSALIFIIFLVIGILLPTNYFLESFYQFFKFLWPDLNSIIFYDLKKTTFRNKRSKKQLHSAFVAGAIAKFIVIMLSLPGIIFCVLYVKYENTLSTENLYARSAIPANVHFNNTPLIKQPLQIALILLGTNFECDFTAVQVDPSLPTTLEGIPGEYCIIYVSVDHIGEVPSVISLIFTKEDLFIQEMQYNLTTVPNQDVTTSSWLKGRVDFPSNSILRGVQDLVIGYVMNYKVTQTKNPWTGTVTAVTPNKSTSIFQRINIYSEHFPPNLFPAPANTVVNFFISDSHEVVLQVITENANSIAILIVQFFGVLLLVYILLQIVFLVVSKILLGKCIHPRDTDEINNEEEPINQSIQ